ncbi:MAG: cold-shock protein [Alphaproteobacteria bacterium]|nr:MAG: cold-shock protein [Alphaproteobacteria bacterium]
MNDSFGSDATPTTVTVKWFSPRKGFGFVNAPGSDRDIFLHISAVTNAGHEFLPDGTTLSCIIGSGQKGQEVKQIISVDTSTAQERPRSNFGDRPPRREGGFGDRPRRDDGFGGGGRRSKYGDGGGHGHRDRDHHAPSGPAQEMTGTVKWYNSQKGFGFVMPEDGSRDVFIHMSTLRRSGLSTLDEGQAVRMRVVNGGKGQEAESIEII